MSAADSYPESDGSNRGIVTPKVVFCVKIEKGPGKFPSPFHFKKLLKNLRMSLIISNFAPEKITDN